MRNHSFQLDSNSLSTEIAAMMKPYWVINLIVTNLQSLIEKKIEMIHSPNSPQPWKAEEGNEVRWLRQPGSYSQKPPLSGSSLIYPFIDREHQPGLNAWGATSHPESLITWSQVKQCFLLGNWLHGNWVFSGFSEVSRIWRVRFRVGKTEHATELPARLWGCGVTVLFLRTFQETVDMRSQEFG